MPLQGALVFDIRKWRLENCAKGNIADSTAHTSRQRFFVTGSYQSTTHRARLLAIFAIVSPSSRAITFSTQSFASWNRLIAVSRFAKSSASTSRISYLRDNSFLSAWSASNSFYLGCKGPFLNAPNVLWPKLQQGRVWGSARRSLADQFERGQSTFSIFITKVTESPPVWHPKQCHFSFSQLTLKLGCRSSWKGHSPTSSLPARRSFTPYDSTSWTRPCHASFLWLFRTSPQLKPDIAPDMVGWGFPDG
jgi:hypothetical protein